MNEERENLVELKRRELKEAKFLWDMQYLDKYIKRHGVIDSTYKRLLFIRRQQDAYFANNKLKKIRNERYELQDMSYREE